MLHAAMEAGATVLDLGCGVGRLARPLAAGARTSGFEVIGPLDRERTWLALAPVRGSSAGS